MRVRWSNLLILLSAPAGLAAVAPWFARWHWSIDLLACFAVQATGALLLAATALAIGRKRLPAIGLSLLSAIGGAAVMPGWWAGPASPQDVGNSPGLRVLALNLLRSNDNGQIAALAVIQGERPDVIFCAEYTPGWQQFFESRLAEYPHRCQLAHPGYFGVAVFSRWPLENAVVMPLAHSWAPAVRAIVDTPQGQIGLLGVHTPPPGLGRRRVAERDQALAAIPAALAGLPARRIVLGDFNATPWNSGFVQMCATAGLSPGTTGDWLPSWPSSLPFLLRIPIDHVLVAGGLVVTSATTGADFGSDHLPLCAVVR